MAEPFGTHEGAPVSRVTLSGGGLTARIIDWGAVVQDLRMEGHPAPLVLGFDRFEDYPAASPHFGAIAGRYANRIAEGRFTLDGREHRADRNFLGRHSLHGGSLGTGRRMWRFGAVSADRATLHLTCADGEMGFPGRLEIACTYSLAEGALAVDLTATTDAATLCNLAHHSYFNLTDGGRTGVQDHLLEVAAGAWTPVDDTLIPTGHVVPVDGTAFDFRAPRPIGDAGHPLDHNFCLAAGRRAPAHAATLRSVTSGVAMEVWTTEPGLQVYDGKGAGRDRPGLDGIAYPPFAGVALEPQVWPDSPNRPYFPQAVLRPGETYRQRTEYRFRQD